MSGFNVAEQERMIAMICPCCGHQQGSCQGGIEALQRIDDFIDKLSKSVETGMYFTGVQYVLPRLIEARGKK